MKLFFACFQDEFLYVLPLLKLNIECQHLGKEFVEKMHRLE